MKDSQVMSERKFAAAAQPLRSSSVACTATTGTVYSIVGLDRLSYLFFNSVYCVLLINVSRKLQKKVSDTRVDPEVLSLQLNFKKEIPTVTLIPGS